MNNNEEKLTITINGTFLQNAIEIYGKTVTKEFSNDTSLEFISMSVDEENSNMLNIIFNITKTRYH